MMNKGQHAANATIDHAHGQATLLTLIEQGILTPEQVQGRVEAVIRTRRQMAQDGLHPAMSQTVADLRPDQQQPCNRNPAR